MNLRLAMRTTDIAHAPWLLYAMLSLVKPTVRAVDNVERQQSESWQCSARYPSSPAHQQSNAALLASARLELKVRASRQTTELARRRQPLVIVPIVPSMPSPNAALRMSVADVARQRAHATRRVQAVLWRSGDFTAATRILPGALGAPL